MISPKSIAEKLLKAIELLRSSCGSYGLFAGSGPRYRHQCWTRDAALALIPALSSIERFSEILFLDLSYLAEVAETHLKSLTKLQGRNGAIPILFADFGELIEKKMRKCSWNGSQLTVNSFILRRILDGMHGSLDTFPEFRDFPNADQRGLYRLTPGTTDSELLFAYALINHYGRSCEAARRAMAYVENHYVHDGLHCGADWRDTMEKFFSDKPLLSNNALLYAVYIGMGEEEKAAALKEAVERTFWTGETYLDYPDAKRFDPLGVSLGIMHGLIPKERHAKLIKDFHLVDSPCGVTIQCRHKPYLEGEAEVIEQTDGIVVWPFVVGFTILATADVDRSFATEQFEKLHNLDGFAEWYDPTSGVNWGEYQQGWSAALYIRAVEKLGLL